jgi:hypothetical protein
MKEIEQYEYNPVYGSERSEKHYEYCKEHRIPYSQMTYDYNDDILVYMIDFHPVDGKTPEPNIKASLHDPLLLFYFTNRSNLNRIDWAIDICREAKKLTGEELAFLMREVLENPGHPLNRDWLLKQNLDT